jgi:hypothetical protein
MSRGFNLMPSAPTLVVPVLLSTHGLALGFFCNKMNPQCGNILLKTLLGYLIAE